MQKAGLRIGKVARQTGIATSAIRFYEEAGLLPRAERTSSRYRIYPEETVERIGFIQKAQDLGLQLKEIREILELSDRGRCPCGHVQRLLKSKSTELKVKIANLRIVQSRIRLALARSSPVGPTGKALCPTIARGTLRAGKVR